MGQNIPGGWTVEQSNALTTLVAEGNSYKQAAIAINKLFGTSYSRNSAIGRANRIGLQSPIRPKSEHKAKYVRKPKTRSGEHHVITKIVRSNGNSNAMRVTQSVVTEYKLRCVEIEPLHLSLIELESGHCRYPYGDGPLTFCGHPQKEGSSYCVPHHFLCWIAPRAPAPFIQRRDAA